MKIKGIFPVLIAVTALITAGCLDNGEDRRRADPKYEARYVGINEVVNSSNEFSFDMYRELVSGDENIFFSPYSITIALGMAYEGARGDTADEIIGVIRLPEDDGERRAMVRDLQSRLNPGDTLYQLNTANAYWLRMDEDLNDDYQYTIENDYKAGGQELDFAGDPSGSADTINTWVEERTNDRIKDLIDASMINPNTYLILTNAIYFKANWKWQFDPEATTDQPFYLSGGGERTVDMMNICDPEIDVNYAENDDVKLLQLPYTDEELSMYIVLPKDDDISSLEGDLDSEYLNGLKTDLLGEWVDIHLPRFKFELRYELNDNLKNMGMEKAFTMQADFSGIKESGESDLYISDVVHQSFVEVNEEGTEAAAATAVVMEDKGGGGEEPQPLEFRADHPFIFFIEHRETGQILFMGKVEDPTD